MYYKNMGNAKHLALPRREWVLQVRQVDLDPLRLDLPERILCYASAKSTGVT